MDLSNDLISSFVKITNDTGTKATEETILYGIATKQGEDVYVTIDAHSFPLRLPLKNGSLSGGTYAHSTSGYPFFSTGAVSASCSRGSSPVYPDTRIPPYHSPVLPQKSISQH